jgi:hypothetical protein
VEQAALVVEQVARALPGRAESDTAWSNLDALGLRARPGARPVAVRWRKPGSEATLVSYWFVPWQPLRAKAERLDVPMLGPQLLTVTELALVFGPVREGSAVGNEAGLARAIEQAVETALGVAAHQKELPTDFAAPVPESLRLLDCKSYAHYVTLTVAVPGSGLPQDAALQRIAPDRMIRVILTPDIGPRTTRWLAPVEQAAESAPADPHAVPTSNPPRSQAPAGLEDAPYAPKTSPDTLLDYRPSLAERLRKLPDASLASLPALLGALAEQRRQAGRDPGRWEEGNPILGADPRQYVPSDAALLESEIGERIRRVAAGSSADPIRAVIAGAGLRRAPVEYHFIGIRHTDVMGSGRFFYAEERVERSVVLP